MINDAKRVVFGSMGRLTGAVAAAFGIAAGGAPAAAQEQVSPEEAPPAWVAFADTANASVTGWLRGEDEVATRLRLYVDGMRPAPDQPSPPLLLKLWFDATGVISQAEFPPFVDEGANNDLRSLLMGRNVGAVPPKGMLMPLRMSVEMTPAPEAEGATDGALETTPSPDTTQP